MSRIPIPNKRGIPMRIKSTRLSAFAAICSRSS